jgi:hypothetical protein
MPYNELKTMNQNDLNELITKALQELLKEKPDLLPVAKIANVTKLTRIKCVFCSEKTLKTIEILIF